MDQTANYTSLHLCAYVINYGSLSFFGPARPVHIPPVLVSSRLVRASWLRPPRSSNDLYIVRACRKTYLEGRLPPSTISASTRTRLGPSGIHLYFRQVYTRPFMLFFVEWLVGHFPSRNSGPPDKLGFHPPGKNDDIPQIPVIVLRSVVCSPINDLVIVEDSMSSYLDLHDRRIDRSFAEFEF